MWDAGRGAAPGIADQGIANPVTLMLAAALMLDHDARVDRANKLCAAIDDTVNTDDIRSAGFTRAIVGRPPT